MTGNTVVEAVTELLPDAEERQALAASFGVIPGQFVLSTFHRPENVDDPEILATILRELASLPYRILLPLHPRTVARVSSAGLGDLLDEIQVVEPIGYREFLGLSAESAFLVSDSGGVQEEASVYKRPVLVVRRSTERPEVIGTFAELVEPGPDIARVAAGVGGRSRWCSPASGCDTEPLRRRLRIPALRRRHPEACRCVSS